ncbi:MAG: SLC13 family permease, partial [Phycisphaerae bacterium]
AVAIPATSLLPLVLMPLLGVMSTDQVAGAYANKYVFLFLGGFILALGLERWELHRRIALRIIWVVGTGRWRLILGFMVAAGLLSMWISNTASTLMLLPIGMAVVRTLGGARGREAVSAGSSGGFGAAVMLGIAYGASIGGVATPIGTPPNISFVGIASRLFPAAPAPSFGQWMAAFAPLSGVFLLATWAVLVWLVCGSEGGEQTSSRQAVRQQLSRLGPLNWPQRAMLLVFVATVVLWMTRATLRLGVATIHGWAELLQRWRPDVFEPRFLHDATVAVGAAVLLFAIPAGRDSSGARRYLMDWSTARRLPWDILLLFGGGFAIAEAFRTTGLSQWIGQVFSGLPIRQPLLLVPGTCTMMTLLTELTSNTATTQVMLPILGSAAGPMGVHPYLLMLPATISASCAFMLPVATPPNAIVFGSGQVRMGQMIRAGIVVNVVGVLLVSVGFYLLAMPLFGIRPAVAPSWAVAGGG